MAASKKSKSRSKKTTKKPAHKSAAKGRSSDVPVISEAQSAVVEQTVSAEVVSTDQSLSPQNEHKTNTLDYFQFLKQLLAGRRFGMIFAVFSAAVLGGTTLLWATLAAKVAQANADQLIDGYLFEGWHTFQAATFPGAHSFLLKWPVFAVMSLLGNTPHVFVAMTVLMAAVTVGALTYMLYRIERRPLLFGGLCLALASVLLQIPAEPYPGALLPANFAMSTTRNLEYVVLLSSMYLIVRTYHLKSRRFVIGTVLAALLVASDKLFMPLMIGGAIVILAIYTRRRDDITKLARLWLGAGIAAAVLATILLFLINSFGMTHIFNETSTSPFPLIHSAKQLAQSILYAVFALFTNFGANPVHSVIIVRDIPSALIHSLASFAIIPYMLNAVIGIVSIMALVAVLRRPMQDVWGRMTILLTGALIMAFGVFILTDHYYPVDSRYVAVELFVLFTGLAVYMRTYAFRFRQIIAILAILLTALPLGIFTAWQHYGQERAALANRNALSAQLAAKLDTLDIHRLIGDYWYITPVKAASRSQLTVVPVSSCIMPNKVLNSAAWDTLAERNQPTAYLAMQTGPVKPRSYGDCSMSTITRKYGIPTKQVVLADQPQSRLLIYAKGVGKPAMTAAVKPQPVPHVPAAVPPQVVSLNNGQPCLNSTHMNIVAHEDDDLLFLSPDILHAVDTGRCQRTIFVTAGDAGGNADYWNNREQGAMAAYAEMYGVENNWRQTYAQVNGKSVMVRTLQAVPKVALVFMRLPDAGLRNLGFAASRFESLQKLQNGDISIIHSVDNHTSYNRQELINTLTALMNIDKPDVIMTQDNSPADGPDDHIDHHMTGLFARAAADNYQGSFTFRTYMGYSSKIHPVNLTVDDLRRKEKTFLTYAMHDAAVCQTSDECNKTITYGSYLKRQYIVSELSY